MSFKQKLEKLNAKADKEEDFTELELGLAKSGYPNKATATEIHNLTVELGFWQALQELIKKTQEVLR